MIDREAREHEQIYPHPGWVEHDPEEIWQNMVKAIRSLLDRTNTPAEDILCLSISNQRETAVVFDKATGKPLHNALVWQCRSGDPVCEKLRNEGHEAFVRERTGLRLDTYFPASKLSRLIDSNDTLHRKLESGEALIGTIDTYLVYRLTRRESFVTDHTNACRTLLYDIESLKWNERLCSLFGVPARALPSIIRSDEIAGRTNIDGVLSIQIPICGIMGDSHASLFAHRCFHPGMVKVTFGTGSSALLNIGHTIRRSVGGAVTTLAWYIGEKPTYSLEGIISFSAATISWLKNQMKLIDSAADTEALAHSVEDNGGVYIVPAFAGLSAPYWNPDARAGILGMSAHSNRAHIARAALESIGYQIRDIIGVMTENGEALSSIHADGGPTANGFLMQFVADITGLQVHVNQMPDVSPLGASLCGALGMGVYQTLTEFESLPENVSTYYPQMPHEKTNTLYAGWKAAVSRVL